MTKRTTPPSKFTSWAPAHSARVELTEAGELLLFDGVGLDYQFLRTSDPRYSGSRLRVVVEAKPEPGGTGVLGFNQWGGHDLGFVHQDGRVVEGLTESLTVDRLPDGYLRIEAVWFNTHHTVTLGSARARVSAPPRTVYDGQNRLQWRFREIGVEVLPLDGQTPVPPAERIAYVDVGARDGVAEPWHQLRGRLLPILVEPDPVEAERLRGTHLEVFNDVVILPIGLADTDEARRLFLTKTAGCSSMRHPNTGLLARYPIANWFTVTDQIEVDCARYDTLVARGEAPIPDVIKIDVQGFECEVLAGFGELLHNVVGVELEAHVYPLYSGQKLLGDIVSYLERYDLALRSLRPQSFEGFGSECVELNAFFTRRPGSSLDRLPGGARKVEVCSTIWNI